MPHQPTTSREAVIERIDGETASLRVGEEVFHWPTSQLPSASQVGDRLRLTLVTPEQETAERSALAKDILNEALNPSS